MLWPKSTIPSVQASPSSCFVRERSHATNQRRVVYGRSRPLRRSTRSRARIRAMRDDASPVPELDPPDPERIYRNYVAQCRRMGVTPAPRDRAKALIREWDDGTSRRPPGAADRALAHTISTSDVRG